MTKDLIREIAHKEAQRLNALSYDELVQEAASWFNDEILPSESRDDIIYDLFTDFMRYRAHESDEELQVVLTTYNK